MKIRKSISIIFPIYNEATRLPNLFKNIKKNKKISYILVNDGSTDNSDKLIKNFIKNNNEIKIKYLKYPINRGKGYSIKMGMNSCRNNWILTADTDLSVEIPQINKWLIKGYLNENDYIYWGSRSNDLSKVNADKNRVFMGKIFKLLLKIFFNISFEYDTQCGFKLYNKKAKKIFTELKLNGFCHDVELFLLCQKFKLRINFLPVKWKHKKNSKINFFTPFKMLIELFYLKFKFF